MQQFQTYPSPDPYSSIHRSAIPYHPVGVPPIQRAGKRLAILCGVIAGAILLLGGGYFLYMKVTPQHEVLVENGNDFAVEIEVGGEKLSLGPRASSVVKAGDGQLTVKATGPGGFSETASIELPKTGFQTGGRTAVYNVGGKSPLAVVSVTYGHVAGAPKPVVMIPAEPRLALLPGGAYGAIDGAFPEEVTTSRSRMGAVIQHVCRVDVQARKIGCPGLDRFFD
jgi:hypothetical protein